jgi:hypothetical protein
MESDEELPLSIRDALSRRFPKKTADKLNRWAEQCNEKDVDDMDDSAMLNDAGIDIDPNRFSKVEDAANGS